jgi:hypothetical protein
MRSVRGMELSDGAGALCVGLYASLFALYPGVSGKLLLAAPLVIVPLLWWTLQRPEAWLLAFAAATLVLPPLPFVIGNSGVHPSLALAAAGLLAGFLRVDEWRLQMEALPARMLLFTALLLGSTGLALLYSGEWVALGSLLRVLLFCVPVYTFFYTAFGPGAASWDGTRMVPLLFWSGVASAAFACVDFVFQFPPPAGYGAQFIWLSSGIYRRAQGVFYEAGMLGNVCAFFLTMIAVALFRPGAPKALRKPVLLAGGAVFAAALLLSFSRSSLLNLGVAMSALAYPHRKQVRWRRLAFRAAILGACTVLAALAAFPVFAQLYWTRILNSFVYFIESPNAILSGRLDSWRYLLHFLSEHPLYALFGVGYKTLPYSAAAGKAVITDNSYLSFLVETGAAGLAAMLGLCFAILRFARRAAGSADPSTAFFGTWIFCFWCGEMVQMTSGDILTYWRVLPLYFWVLAMAVRPR